MCILTPNILNQYIFLIFWFCLMLTILQNLVSIMFFLIKCVSPDISYKVFIEDKTKEKLKSNENNGISGQYVQAGYFRMCSLILLVLFVVSITTVYWPLFSLTIQLVSSLSDTPLIPVPYRCSLTKPWYKTMPSLRRYISMLVHRAGWCWKL